MLAFLLSPSRSLHIKYTLQMHAHKHAHRGRTSSPKKKKTCLSWGQRWQWIADQTESRAHLRRFRKAWMRSVGPPGFHWLPVRSTSRVPAGSEQVGRQCYTHLIDFITPFLTGVGEPLAHYKTPERAHMHICTHARSLTVLTWMHTINTLPDRPTHTIYELYKYQGTGLTSVFKHLQR